MFYKSGEKVEVKTKYLYTSTGSLNSWGKEFEFVRYSGTTAAVVRNTNSKSDKFGKEILVNLDLIRSAFYN